MFQVTHTPFYSRRQNLPTFGTYIRKNHELSTEWVSFFDIVNDSLKLATVEPSQQFLHTTDFFTLAPKKDGKIQAFYSYQVNGRDISTDSWVFINPGDSPESVVTKLTKKAISHQKHIKNRAENDGNPKDGKKSRNPQKFWWEK